MMIVGEVTVLHQRFFPVVAIGYLVYNYIRFGATPVTPF
jgi:hypothetical protein